MIIKPGDTVVFSVDQARSEDITMVRKALMLECPDVNWMVVAGGRESMIYRPKRRNRFKKDA